MGVFVILKFKSLKDLATFVWNCVNTIQKNKYNLMLCQSRLHTASKTANFDQVKFSTFCASVASILRRV